MVPPSKVEVVSLVTYMGKLDVALTVSADTVLNFF